MSDETKRGGQRRTPEQMTKWDAGNSLTYLADEIADKESELRKHGFTELADTLHKARMEIGTAFNKLGAHDFGLPDYRDCNCKYCERRYFEVD